jgi:hypothetical protein
MLHVSRKDIFFSEMLVNKHKPTSAASKEKKY